MLMLESSNKKYSANNDISMINFSVTQTDDMEKENSLVQITASSAEVKGNYLIRYLTIPYHFLSFKPHAMYAIRMLLLNSFSHV